MHSSYDKAPQTTGLLPISPTASCRQGCEIRFSPRTFGELQPSPSACCLVIFRKREEPIERSQDITTIRQIPDEVAESVYATVSTGPP